MLQVEGVAVELKIWLVILNALSVSSLYGGCFWCKPYNVQKTFTNEKPDSPND